MQPCELTGVQISAVMQRHGKATIYLIPDISNKIQFFDFSNIFSLYRYGPFLQVVTILAILLSALLQAFCYIFTIKLWVTVA